MDNYDEKLDGVVGGEADIFNNEVRLFLKAFAITFIICALIASGWWYGSENKSAISKGKFFTSKREEVTETFAEVKASHDKIVEWNKLYDEGRYDELEAAVNENRDGYSYYWKHYELISMITDLQNADEILEQLAEGKGTTYRYTNLLYTLVKVRYSLTDKNSSLDSEEKTVLRERMGDRETKILEAIPMSAGEFDTLYAKATAEGYMSYSVISNYADERWAE